jgi:D-alanyl-D-alanine-carboxypeptidase/D-alanyl-D-alanine-endopeptidase
VSLPARRALGACLAWLVAAAVPAPTAQVRPSLPADAEVLSMLAPRLDPRADLGVVVGLLDGAGQRVVVAGRAGPGGTPPLDGNTIFEIGSVTKVLTASVLSVMVQAGEVKLEDPVQQFLPPAVKVPARGGKVITLLDLATQSSGLPRLPANLSPKDIANPYVDYTVPDLYDFLSKYELPRDIGAQYEYSNVGFGLLGHVLALKAGTSYEAMVRKRILAPLRMRDTAITLTHALKARLAVGHYVTGLEASNWDLPTLAGAGAFRSSVNDLLKFAGANLAGTGRLAAALKDAQAARREAGSAGMKIGLAWHISGRFDRPIVWHNGGTGGYHSFVGLDPLSGTAVVILHNSARSFDDVGLHLLDGRYPLADPATLPKARFPIKVDPARLDAYAGEYVISPAVSATVTRQGDRLVFAITGQAAAELLPESETEFFLKIADVQVSFVKNQDGTITELVLHQNGRDARARRR